MCKKKFSRFLCLITLLHIVFTSYLKANPNFQRKVRIYNTADGLSIPIVTSIEQDNKGYLWIGTLYGINRFDGKKFLNFTMQEGLPSDIVNDVIYDKDEKLWIATQKGLCYLDLTSGKIISKFGGNSFEKLINKIQLYKKYLFIGTNEGLFILDKETESIREIPLQKNTQVNKEKIAIYYIVPDIENSKIYAASNHTVFSFSYTSEVPEAFSKESQISFQEKTILGIGRNEKNELLVAFQNDGIRKLDFSMNANLPLVKELFGISISSSETYRIMKDSEGKIFSFIDDKNIYFKEKNTKEIFKVPTHFSNFKHAFVCSLIDKEDNFWIGTNGSGLLFYYKTKHVEVLPLVKDKKDRNKGLIDGNTSYIFKDSSENLLFGSASAIAIRYKNGRYVNIEHGTNSNQKIAEVRWIIEDNQQKGKYWFTTNNGLWVLENEKAQRIESTKDTIVYCVEQIEDKLIYNDHQDTLYLLSKNKLHSQPKKISEHKQIIWYMQSFQEHNQSFVIMQGPELITQYDGNNFSVLYDLDSFYNKIKNLSKEEIAWDIDLNKISKPSRFEKVHFIDSENYILTFGKYIYFSNNSKVKLRNYAKDLRVGFNTSLLQDKNGVLWIGTSNGVVRFDPNEDIPSHKPSTLFTQSDGLASNFSRFSAIVSQDDFVYIGSNHSVTKININKPYVNLYEPDAYVSEITVRNNENGKEIKSLLGNEDFWKNIPYDYNNISFGFSVLSYVNPEQNQLEFKLEKYDSEYIRVLSMGKEKIYYTNLPEGEYALKIRGINSDGIPNKAQKESVFRFRILPPWYRSIWAYIFYIFGFIGIVFSYSRIRNYQLKQKQKILEREVKIKTEQLQNEKQKISEMLSLIESELSIGKSVQSFLIPPFSYNGTWIQIYGNSISSKDLGGDFFHVLPSENEIYIMIGDVSGKGIGSALIMSSTLSLMNHSIRMEKSLAKAMNNVNQGLCHVLSLKRRSRLKFFVTAFLAKIYKKKNNIYLTWCNAGHVYPLILRDGNFLELKSKSLVLGIDKENEFHEENFLLQKNDLLFFFTDGIIEQDSETGNLFRIENVMRVLKQNHSALPSEIVEILFKELNEFRDNLPRSDDWTVVVVKIG